MLVLVQHLIRNGRYGRARVTELGRLLARFEAQPGPLLADPSVRALATRIAHLKRQLAEAFDEVRACSGCAAGCVAPAGFFEGGRCCGTSTLEVFTQAEVRALKLADVQPPRAPADDGDERAGCLFRGRTGCSLSPEARPTKCAVYVCLDLRVELDEAPREETPSDAGEERPAPTARDAAPHEPNTHVDPPRPRRVDALRRELAEAFALFEEMTR